MEHINGSYRRVEQDGQKEQELLFFYKEKFAPAEVAKRQTYVDLPDEYKNVVKYSIEDIEDGKFNKESYTEFTSAHNKEFQIEEVFLEKCGIEKDKVKDVWKLPKDELEKLLDRVLTKDDWEKKWSEISVLNRDGSRREALVELINERTLKQLQKVHGFKEEMLKIDPITHLYLNPLLSLDKHLRLPHGRGLGGKYGINEAIDLRVRIKDSDPEEFLLFKRKGFPVYPDQDQYVAGIGGICDQQSINRIESPDDAMQREAGEEAKFRLPKGVEPLNLGTYFVADPRNTALQTYITTIFEVELTREQANEYLEQNSRRLANASSDEEVVQSSIDFYPISALSHPKNVALQKGEAEVKMFADHGVIYQRPDYR